MEYYYCPADNIDEANSRLKISGTEFRHLSLVLKKRVDENINVTDGNYNVYNCRIMMINKVEIVCEILDKKVNIFEQEIKLTLCLSLLKNMDRLEFAIEKAVELGIYEIIPVISKFSINQAGISDVKLKRLNSIVISAMKQSQRCYLPKIRECIKLEKLIEISKDYESKIVMYEFADTKIKIENRNLNKNCLLLIGPEGGFSNDEIELLKAGNWIIDSLGDRKLRAETAAIISTYKILNN